MATENRFFPPMIEQTDLRQLRAELIVRHQTDDPNHPLKKFLPQARLASGLKKKGWRNCIECVRDNPQQSDIFVYFKEYTGDTIPEYDYADIHNLAFGDCNIKKANQYLLHCKDSIECWINPRYPQKFIFRGIYSRYQDNSKKIKKERACILDFSNEEEKKEENEPDNALRFMEKQRKWYGLCKVGARTINPCAHITTCLMFIWLVRLDEYDAHIEKIKPHHFKDAFHTS